MVGLILDITGEYVMELLKNLTALPEDLYSENVVVISESSLEQVYRSLLVKTVITLVVGIVVPMKIGSVAYSKLIQYIARKKLQKVMKAQQTEYTVPESTDISDASIDYSDSENSEYSERNEMEEGEIKEEKPMSSGSDISSGDITNIMMEPMPFPSKMNEDHAVTSYMYQGFLRSKKRKI